MTGSFSKIIYKLYGNELDKEVNDYITLNFNVNNIIDIKYCGLISIYANNEIINFNAKYLFKNIVEKNLLGDILEYSCYVHCECKINDSITDFKIKRKACNELQLRPNENGLIEFTDDLIPIDRKYPMYNDVQLLFQKYDPNRKSVDGVRVDVYKLVELMGLKIYEDFAFKDLNHSATICFFDTELSLINTKSNLLEKHKFKKGSIILNNYYLNERGHKSVNFAIAHEIYHWIRHKNYIVLRHMLNDGALFHKTITRTKYFWRNNDERVEVQANKFAGTLLLQNDSIYADFLNNIFNKGYLYDLDNREKIIDEVLNEFSDLYDVSKKNNSHNAIVNHKK